MFETLRPPEPDKILRLMAMFAADPRSDKVDLGVGVYRTPAGVTPVMAAVKAAEVQIWEAQESKGYTALPGDPAFLDALSGLILGDAIESDRIAACATPGGTGAVRQILEMVRRLSPEACVWMPDPTWPNHPAITQHLAQKTRSYRYYDAATGGIDRAGMLADLEQMAAGDVLLLHACCHNPTGADLLPRDWADIAALCAQTGAIPFVDMAYLGFGDGVEDDAAGTRLLAARLPEVLIAASCSKNFGLYRDRVGLAIAVTEAGAPRAAAAGILAGLNRQSYAFPPDHGARVVQTILDTPALRTSWAQELAEMRMVLQSNREGLAQALRAETGSDQFGFFASHKGMFSLCGASPSQVETLRATHGIYIVGDGRLNVAGLTPQTIPQVAHALAQLLG